MLRLALIVALIWTPVAAADHTPWADWQDWAPPPLALALDEAQPALGQKCCKHCTKGQPCGNACISAKSKCKSAPGCAC